MKLFVSPSAITVCLESHLLYCGYSFAFLHLVLMVLQYAVIQCDHFYHNFLIFSILIIIFIIYWCSWKFSELISIFMPTTQEVERPVWSEMGESQVTLLYFWTILWQLVFLYLLIYYSCNYFKYQRRSQAQSYLFRNQISVVIFAIMLQKTYQKQQTFGDLFDL